jgi:hypothetical protein
LNGEILPFKQPKTAIKIVDKFAQTFSLEEILEKKAASKAVS